MAVKKSNPGQTSKGARKGYRALRGSKSGKVGTVRGFFGRSDKQGAKMASAERRRTSEKLTEAQRLAVIKLALDVGFVDALKLSDTDLLALVNIGRAVAGIHEKKLTNCALDFAEIIRRVSPWAGGLPRALDWYRNVALPGYGKTAAELTRDGRARSVRMYLDEIAAGGYA